MRSAIAWFSWWAVMGGFLGAAWWLSPGGSPSAELVGTLTIANSIFLVVAEQLLPRVPTNNLLRDWQSLCDMLHGSLFQYAGRPLAQALGASAVTAASALFAGASGLWPHALPLAAQVVLGIVLWSALNYAYHRSLHRVEKLWWFHAVHHDTRQMHLLKSGRIHVGEEFGQFLWVPTVFFVLGVSPEVMGWVALYNVVDGNLVHANLDQRFPSWAHWLLPTVQNHYVHHAEARRLQDSNYASLPFIDVLFGTYRHPDRNPVAATGLSGDPLPRNFFLQVLYPFRSLLDPKAARAEPRPE